MRWLLAYSRSVMQIDKAGFFLASALIILCSIHLLSAAVPRTTLAHFEKDLRKMTKSSKMPVVKKGSFVDRLAGKRLQKEEIDQSLAALEQEVDQLKLEVAQLESMDNELEQATHQAIENIEKQNILAQRVTMELESEQAALQTMRT